MNSFTSFAITFGLVAGVILAESGARAVWNRSSQPVELRHRFVTRGALIALLPAIVLAFVVGITLAGKASSAVLGSPVPGLVLSLVLIVGGGVTCGAAVGCVLCGQAGRSACEGRNGSSLTCSVCRKRARMTGAAWRNSGAKSAGATRVIRS